jgi:hypothetical protein
MNADNRRVLVRFTHVGIIVGSLMLLAGCGKDFSRAQFKTLTMDKTGAEVKAAVGDPSWVSSSKPERWIYYRKTFNAKNQKEDYSATLNFYADATTGQSKVANVEFSTTSN